MSRTTSALNWQSSSTFTENAFPYIGFALLALVVCFTVLEIFRKEYALAASGVAATLMLVLDLAAANRLPWRRERTHALTFAALAVIPCLLVYRDGAYGAYWAYPLFVLFPFVLERRLALTLSVTFGAVLAPVIGQTAALPDAIRILCTMVFSSAFAFIFSMLFQRHTSELEQQVISDALTGAFNRRHFNSRIQMIVEMKTRHGHNASLILFDIDHFKGINDSYGHAAGDRVLRILAETVMARIRVLDELYRYGGEEFAIILPDTRIQDAARLAQEITDMVARVRVIAGGPVTISCGVAELKQGEDVDPWLKRCDDAMYEAKRRGRGRVCVAGDEINKAPHTPSSAGSAA